MESKTCFEITEPEKKSQMLKPECSNSDLTSVIKDSKCVSVCLADHAGAGWAAGVGVGQH